MGGFSKYFTFYSMFNRTSSQPLHEVFDNVCGSITRYIGSSCSLWFIRKPPVNTLFPSFSDQYTIVQAMMSIIVHVYVS